MKKIIAMLTCVLMIMGTVLPMSAVKSDAATVAEYTEDSGDEKIAILTPSVSDKSYHRGDSFDVTVSISDCDVIKAISITINVDENIFEVVEGRSIDELRKKSVLSSYSDEIHTLVAAMSQDTPITGNIAVFTLRVKQDAEFCDTVINMSSIVKVKQAAGGIETAIPSRDEDVTVKIECDHQWQYKEGVAPTCVSEGYAIYSCQLCGAEKTDYLDADIDAHNWEVDRIVDYTCTEDGYTVYKCAGCGAEKIDDITPAAHRYEVIVFEPTPFARRGYTLHTCLGTCGDRYKDNYTYYEETDAHQAIIESVYGKAGEEVNISLVLKNAGELKAICISDLQYDHSKLELVSAGWTVNDAIIQDWNMEDEIGVLAYTRNTPVDGAVFTFTFKLNDDIEDYETLVSCNFTAKTRPDGEIETDVDFEILGGKVWVAVTGDVNGDSTVDSDDAIYLLYHALDTDNYDYEINQRGDFNGDGMVDSDDAIYLLYHSMSPEDYPLM